MLTKDQAIEFRDHVLRAMDCLGKAASIADPSDPSEEQLRKVIGLAMGDLIMEALCKIYEVYPEIDPQKS